jgi:hypothetical protein
MRVNYERVIRVASWELNDVVFTNCVGLRLHILNDKYEPVSSYDVGYLNMSVRPVTADSGGVVCIVRVIGEAAEGGKNIRFPSYQLMTSDITIGRRARVELITREDEDEDKYKVLITGRVSNTGRTNASYAEMLKNQLEVSIVTDWDFLNVIPKGALVTQPLDRVNILKAESLMLANKKMLADDFQNVIRDTISTSSGGGAVSVNVGKALAAVIDNVEEQSITKRSTNNDPGIFQSSLQLDGAAKLRVPKVCVPAIIRAIATLVAEYAGRVSNKQVYTAILDVFYMYLVPRVSIDSDIPGLWEPKPIPNNIWARPEEDEDTVLFGPDSIIAVNQTASKNKTGEFAGVAVRYRSAPEDKINEIDIINTTIYAHTTSKSGKIEKLVKTVKSSNSKSNKLSHVTESGDIVNLDGSFILKDMPAWLGHVYPAGKITKDNWSDQWSALVAMAEFAKYNGASQSMVLQVTPSNLDTCLSSIGKIIAVNFVPAEVKKDGFYSSYRKEDNLYGRVVGVNFDIVSVLNNFKTTLTVTLQGVRGYTDQKNLCIPNEGIFDIDVGGL